MPMKLIQQAPWVPLPPPQGFALHCVPWWKVPISCWQVCCVAGKHCPNEQHAAVEEEPQLTAEQLDPDFGVPPNCEHCVLLSI